MANIISTSPGTINVGEIIIPAPTAGSTNVDTLETTGSFSVPSGCYRVKIRNNGFVKDGDLEVDATVNGEDWHVGREEEFLAVLDPVENVYKTLPAFVGNGNGSRVSIRYEN